MQRLSGLDAMFLYMETPTNHMHVTGVFLLDPSAAPGGFSFEQVRDMVGAAPAPRAALQAAARRGALPPRAPAVDRGSGLRSRLPRAPGVPAVTRRTRRSSSRSSARLSGCPWTGSAHCGRCTSSRASKAAARPSS